MLTCVMTDCRLQGNTSSAAATAAAAATTTTTTTTKMTIRCYQCGRTGHTAAQCMQGRQPLEVIMDVLGRAFQAQQRTSVGRKLKHPHEQLPH
ncbi:hypothetical protein IQ07DRAFT_314010 [Pyrenochaeta sp. DS3sAY3a]|nr:hypothetical protein IQ07DRAFT_314010 [Pyrenochaeta sp. DS3sAY3a]